MTALQRIDIEQALRVVHDLPSLPAVVLDLLAGLDDDELDIGTLERKIAQDQALAAQTLRIANSSFYGRQRQVGTIGQAVSVLGLADVRRLVITATMVAVLPADSRGGGFRAFWLHAIGSGLCARALAAQVGLNQDFAYACGLLHDIGRLVLTTRFADAYRAVATYRAKTDCYLIEAEQQVLGLDHTLVGDALAQHWKFPLQMQKTIANHHAAERHDVDGMALLVHASDAMAHALDFSDDDDDLVPLVHASTWRHLNLDEQKLRAALADADRRFEVACSVLF